VDRPSGGLKALRPFGGYRDDSAAVVTQPVDEMNEGTGLGVKGMMMRMREVSPMKRTRIRRGSRNLPT